MTDDKVYVSFTMTLENVDVVMNALQEKEIAIRELRESIYNIAKSQLDMKEQSQEQIEEENKSNKKKGKNK